MSTSARNSSLFLKSLQAGKCMKGKSVDFQEDGNEMPGGQRKTTKIQKVAKTRMNPKTQHWPCRYLTSNILLRQMIITTLSEYLLCAKHCIKCTFFSHILMDYFNMDYREGFVSHSRPEHWSNSASSGSKSQAHQLLALLSRTRYLTFM